jgi:paired amphipathic helix protein Sin3a
MQEAPSRHDDLERAAIAPENSGPGTATDSTSQQHDVDHSSSGHPAPTRAQAAAATNSVRMKHEDAMEFLERVRDIFADRPFIYNSFLAVMKEFKDQSINTDGVINRVKLLFKGHPDLLQGFNLFLPPPYRIKVEAESPPDTATAKIEDRKAQQFASAYRYVTKVKKRFATAPHTYKEFLTVLHKYQMVHRSVDLVNTQITRLFRSHPDLLSEFAMFLPERKPKNDSSGGAGPAASKVNSNKKSSGKEAKALDPSGSPSYMHEDKGRRDLQLFERIKKRLGNPLSNSTHYNDFLKCVHLFTQDVLSRDDLVEVLQDLLGTHRELFADFKLFLGVRDSDTQAHLPMCVSDLDLSKAPQAGTSYKKLPDDFCPPPASNCTTLYAPLAEQNFPLLIFCVQLPRGSEHAVGQCCHGKRRLQLQALSEEPVRSAAALPSSYFNRGSGMKSRCSSVRTTATSWTW